MTVVVKKIIYTAMIDHKKEYIAESMEELGEEIVQSIVDEIASSNFPEPELLSGRKEADPERKRRRRGGRKPVISEEIRKEVIRLKSEGKYSNNVDLARALGIGISSLYRILKEEEQK
jgi:transcriptional regulator with PAS, ATPase and Fis domain